MTSGLVRDYVRVCAPVTSRAARTALCLVGVTTITACTRVDAASAPAGALRSTDFATVSFKAPPGTYDAVMAQRGKVHFNQYCAQCHVKPKRGEKPVNPYVRLRQLGRDTIFFADGSANSLLDVVEHYEKKLGMHLTRAQQNDLVEYLKAH